jgi:1-acyl-sn-glycerol-3-phosphate acyltransferase
MRTTLLSAFAATDPGRILADLIASRLKATLHGAENIPKAGGALFVGNHGLLGIDSVALASLLIRETGRAPRFLGEKNLFRIPGLRAALAAVGAIPGVPDDAIDLLKQGELVGVYPGGVDDSFKLSSEAYELKWAARAGFARVALGAQVPILPIAGLGIDELFDVRKKSWIGGALLGSSRYNLPLPESFLPRATELSFHVLPAIPPEGSASNTDDVHRMRDRTRDALESVLAPYRESRRAHDP